MQNKTNENSRINYLLVYKKIIHAFPVLAAVIAFGYFMALKSDFDAVIGHFDKGSVWFYVFSAGIVIAVSLAAVLAKMSSEKLSITKAADNNAVTLFGFVLAAVLALILFVVSATDLSLGLLGTFGKYAAYLLPFISISFVLSLSTKFRSSTLRLICTSLAAISVTLTMFEMYFDFSVPLNSPVRNLSTIANSAVMLFLYAESRLMLKAPNRRITSQFYIFVYASATSVSLGITLGAIFSKIISPIADDPNMSLFRLALYAAISLIALSRLFELPKISIDFISRDEKEPSTNSSDETTEENTEFDENENNNSSDIQ